MITDIPAQYSQPYAGVKSTAILPSADIIRVCHKGPNVLACSIPGLHSCLVFIPKVGPGGVGERMQAFLIRWENARCNGWADPTARVY